MEKYILIFFGRYLFLLLAAWLTLYLLAFSRLIPGFNFTSRFDLILDVVMAIVFAVIANFFVAGRFVRDHRRVPSIKEAALYSLLVVLIMIVVSLLTALVALLVSKGALFTYYYFAILSRSIVLLRPFTFDILASLAVGLSILYVIIIISFSWGARITQRGEL